jgi:hypothetical protein
VSINKGFLLGTSFHLILALRRRKHKDEKLSNSEDAAGKMKQAPGTRPSRVKTVSTSTRRSSPLPSRPSTPPKLNLHVSGMHSSPPDAPRRKGTFDSGKHVMSSPPSPSPQPRRRTQPISFMRYSPPSTPSSRTLSPELLSGEKIPREKPFLQSSRLKVVPSAGSTLLSEHTRPQMRNNEASTPTSSHGKTNILNGEPSVVPGNPTTQQSQRVGISEVRSAGTGRLPTLQQVEDSMHPKASSVASNTKSPSSQLVRGTESSKEGLTVPDAPSSAKTKEQHALSYESAIGSQSNAGQMGGLTAITRVPTLYSFPTQTPQGQFATQRSAPLQSRQRGVLVSGKSPQTIQSPPSAQGQTRELFTEHGSPLPTRRTNALAPDLSSPAVQSPHPNQPAQNGLHTLGQLVKSTQSLNRNVGQLGTLTTSSEPLMTQSPSPRQGEKRPRAVRLLGQCVNTSPIRRRELGSGSASPDPLSAETLPPGKVRWVRGIATSSGSQAMQSSPLRRPQQTGDNNTSPDPLSMDTSLGLPQPTRSPAVGQFDSDQPFLFPKPVQETHPIDSLSTTMQSSSPIRVPGAGQPITSQTARGDQPSSSLQSSQREVPQVLHPVLRITSLPVQLGQVGVNSMRQSPGELPPLPRRQTQQISSSATSAVPSLELSLNPSTQQTDAVSTQLSSAGEPLSSHPEPQQRSDQVTSVAPNTSLQADPQVQQTETSNISHARSSAPSTPEMRLSLPQRQSSNLGPRGAGLANQGHRASLPSDQEPSSSYRPSSSSFLPTLPTPNDQGTGTRLNQVQNNHLRTRHRLPSRHGNQSMAIPSLPQNLYPSLFQRKQKRRLNTEGDMNQNLQTKRQVINQNTKVNPALGKANVPYDLGRKIKAFTGKLVFAHSDLPQ